ncbi:Glycosyltransferase involved in cell wall bisynthesis [Moraxellaceae bacterium 17A]|nr:Glycosyltransferase involved in cell wall bisynthesis [Moraxellaceae bacterium 17A]
MEKVLIVIPDINKAGGSERAAISLANMLCDESDVTILSLVDNGNIPFFALHQKIKILYTDIGNIPISGKKKLIYFYNLYKHLKNFLNKNDFRFIIGLGHNINSVIALLKNKNNVVIGCEHINYDTIPTSSKILMRLVYPKLDAVVVLSELAKKKIKNLNNKIYVIPNSLPFITDKVSDLASNRILMVGRLSAEKGYERIVPVAKYLKQHFPTWRIDIFGEGEIYTDLIDLYQENELSNVSINPISKNIEKEYLTSSILLSTSYSEAMPMVFLEAMSCGVPIISFSHEGSEILIQNGINGFIVNGQNELQEKINIMIKDTKLRSEMGINCIEISKKYQSYTIKNLWLNLLSK